jgi:Flp pilus assembly protein TadD
MPRSIRFLLALCASLPTVVATSLAQTTPAPAAPAKPAAVAPAAPAAPVTIGAEMSDEARKAYAQGLKDARELITKKDYPAAITKLDALNAQRPREPQARFLKGVVQTEEGDNDAALATFLALTSDFPELPEPYNNLAVLYAKKGQYEGARVALETAVKAAPDWAVAHENLGDVYVRIAAGEYERASMLDKEDKSASAKLVLARDILKAAPAATPAKPAPGAASAPAEARTAAPAPATTQPPTAPAK